MAKLKKNYLVTKQNALNEMRYNSMSLQELRLFSVYLSKINHSDINTREVVFPVSEFQSITNTNNRIGREHYEKIAEKLAGQIIKIRVDNEIRVFSLFKMISIGVDGDDVTYFKLDAHDEALPMLFDYKNRYFSYQLWNALSLKSKNQLRMYEILKQCEWIGYRVISIVDLKEQLGISENEYTKYKDFKCDVLEVCRKALSENTDISYTYESCGKKGPKGKILNLRFTISKNTNYIDPLALEQLIDIESRTKTASAVILEEGSPKYRERIDLLSEACNNEFSRREVQLLNNMLSEHMPDIFRDQIKCYDYLFQKYREMLVYDERNGGIKHRFRYLCKAIKTA